MTAVAVEVSIEISPTDAELIERRLAGDGEAKSEPRRYQPLAVLLRDTRGQVVGGLKGATVWGWLEIKQLWVEEVHRGLGWGARLVEAAEGEAVRRGCRHVWVDTFDFQAPQFYQRLGYEQFAQLEDFPRGHQRLFFRKLELQASNQSPNHRMNPPAGGGLAAD